jgi:hypothetical protein
MFKEGSMHRAFSTSVCEELLTVPLVASERTSTGTNDLKTCFGPTNTSSQGAKIVCEAFGFRKWVRANLVLSRIQVQIPNINSDGLARPLLQ